MAEDRDDRLPVDDYLVDRPLDLNTATGEELRMIEGLGAGRADRIVEWREAHGPFEAVDQLQHVPDMTPDVLRQVRHRLKV